MKPEVESVHRTEDDCQGAYLQSSQSEVLDAASDGVDSEPGNLHQGDSVGFVLVPYGFGVNIGIWYASTES